PRGPRARGPRRGARGASATTATTTAAPRARQLRATGFPAARVDRNGVGQQIPFRERDVDALHALRRLLGAQQDATLAPAGTSDVGEHRDVLERLVEHEPAA